jgi:hypothetical protein
MSKQNGLSNYDSNNVIRDAHNESNNALDVIAVNGLVPSRFSKIDLTYITAGDGLGEIGDVRYYSDGEYQQQTITFRNDEVGSAAKTAISFYNRTPQNLAGTYFVIHDDVGPVGIFFDTDGANSLPISSTVYRFITVSLAGSDTEVDIASKLVSTLDVDSKFFAVGNQAFTVVSNRTRGTREDSYDFNSNLYLRNTAGIDPNTLDGTYFFINSALDAAEYYVWYNVDAVGTDPLISGKTAIPVVIASGDSAISVASATSSALSSLFTVVLDSNKVTVTNKLIGVTTRIQDITSSMPSITMDVLGEDRVLVAHLVLTYAANKDLISVERQ